MQIWEFSETCSALPVCFRLRKSKIQSKAIGDEIPHLRQSGVNSPRYEILRKWDKKTTFTKCICEFLVRCKKQASHAFEGNFQFEQYLRQEWNKKSKCLQWRELKWTKMPQICEKNHLANRWFIPRDIKCSSWHRLGYYVGQGLFQKRQIRIKLCARRFRFTWVGSFCWIIGYGACFGLHLLRSSCLTIELEDQKDEFCTTLQVHNQPVAFETYIVAAVTLIGMQQVHELFKGLSMLWAALQLKSSCVTY